MTACKLFVFSLPSALSQFYTPSSSVIASIFSLLQIFVNVWEHGWTFMHLEYSVNHRSTHHLDRCHQRLFSFRKDSGDDELCQRWKGWKGRSTSLTWQYKKWCCRNDRDGFLVWFFFLRINESWPCSTSLISIIKSLSFFFFAFNFKKLRLLMVDGCEGRC